MSGKVSFFPSQLGVTSSDPPRSPSKALLPTPLATSYHVTLVLFLKNTCHHLKWSDLLAYMFIVGISAMVWGP